MKMSIKKVLSKRNLPTLFFSVFGLFILFSYYSGLFKPQAAIISRWPITLANFAIILGIVTIVRYHATKIMKQEKEWYFNALTLTCIIVTFYASLNSPEMYLWIRMNIIQTLQTALSSFVGFYMFTLFYRAARVKNLEVTLLIVCCIFIFLWIAPIGALIHPRLPAIGQWINDVPNAGAMRGILISIAIGMIGLFIRSILGYEKSHIGG